MVYLTILRQKFLDYYRKYSNFSWVSWDLNISLSILKQWKNSKKKRCPLNHRLKGSNATKVDKGKLLQYIAEHPDVYQYEISESLGCTAPKIHYIFKSMGIARKRRERSKSKNPKK